MQREAEPEWQPGSQTLDLISQSKIDKDKKQPVVSRTHRSTPRLFHTYASLNVLMPKHMTDPRRLRELRTVEAMLACYCRGAHGGCGLLCEHCNALLNYAATRLERCQFGCDKPVCAKCPVHCYQPRMRDQIKQVMRYAGPHMLLRHPILTIRHFVDARCSPRPNSSL